jgi:hypothetical protein
MTRLNISEGSFLRSLSAAYPKRISYTRLKLREEGAEGSEFERPFPNLFQHLEIFELFKHLLVFLDVQDDGGRLALPEDDFRVFPFTRSFHGIAFSTV